MQRDKPHHGQVAVSGCANHLFMIGTYIACLTVGVAVGVAVRVAVGVAVGVVVGVAVGVAVGVVVGVDVGSGQAFIRADVTMRPWDGRCHAGRGC